MPASDRRARNRYSPSAEKLTPLYHVVLLDDDDHTYDYVVEMLTKIFLPAGGIGLRSRGGSGHHRPHHRDHL